MKIQIPTKSNPLKIGDDFTLYDTYFIYESKRYDISEIDDLSYNADKQIMNAVAINIDYLLHIGCGKKNINLSSSSMVFSTKKGKAIRSAYAYLSQATFNTRLNKYIHKYNQDGFIKMSNATFFQNGEVHRDGKIISLIDAISCGQFCIGTDRRFGLQGTVNPDEVYIANKKGFGKTTINFTLYGDTDVLKALLRLIAESVQKNVK